MYKLWSVNEQRECYCSFCGAETNEAAEVCVKCGAKLKKLNGEPKSKIVAGLLGVFLGAFGIHRFYLGYTTIETEDLAHYFADYRWKKTLPDNLFEQIFQINQLNINEYFDFESLEAQTNKEITLEDINLSELF